MLTFQYSTQGKGYKTWDIESSKLIVSRDLTFDESSLDAPGIEIHTNSRQPSNLAVPGGDAKEEVDDKIDLAPEIHGESKTTEVANSNENLKDAQVHATFVPRRSNRVRKRTGEWWEALPASSPQALFVQEIPTSFKLAN